ncbi:MAG: hypothetical protein LBE56_04185 [Tannerella sp.]|jgi:exopolysaccharide biosynthesis protein|nr:hypothetical protein [Tannerella sp.]
MKKMILIALVSFAVILFIIWQYAKNEGKLQTGIGGQTEQYEATVATIDRIFESGRSYKRSTLLHVSYFRNEQQRKATLRRQGYKEGTYTRGDTITIYVNRKDPYDIK